MHAFVMLGRLTARIVQRAVFTPDCTNGGEHEHAMTKRGSVSSLQGACRAPNARVTVGPLKPNVRPLKREHAHGHAAMSLSVAALEEAGKKGFALQSVRMRPALTPSTLDASRVFSHLLMRGAMVSHRGPSVCRRRLSSQTKAQPIEQHVDVSLRRVA